MDVIKPNYPIKGNLTDLSHDTDNLLFQRKYDGRRAQLHIEKGHISALYIGNLNHKSDKPPGVKPIRAPSWIEQSFQDRYKDCMHYYHAIIDGEFILDRDCPIFEGFDILAYNYADLRRVPIGTKFALLGTEYVASWVVRTFVSRFMTFTDAYKLDLASEPDFIEGFIVRNANDTYNIPPLKYRTEVWEEYKCKVPHGISLEHI